MGELMSKKNIYVEFVGITNSGKTRLMSVIRERLEKRGFNVITPYDLKLRDKLLAGLKIPFTIYRWMVLSVKITISFKGTLLFLRKIIPALFMSAATRQKKNTVYILDEGILHKFRRLRKISRKNITIDEVIPEKSIDKYFPEVPDFVLFINVDPNIYRQRKLNAGIYIDMEAAKRQLSKMKYSRRDSGIFKNRKTELLEVPNNNEAQLQKAAEMFIEKLI